MAGPQLHICLLSIYLLNASLSAGEKVVNDSGELHSTEGRREIVSKKLIIINKILWGSNKFCEGNKSK